ncbi:MAG: c-type cytochrome [Alphaproteobacteria bacterium]
MRRLGPYVLALTGALGYFNLAGGLALAESPAPSRQPVAGASQNRWTQDSPRNPGPAWSLARGGRLYDNWAAALGKSAPTRSHLLYPRAGKKTGAASWRCKECHGWDTNGAKGAYAKGSHFTGIKGLRAMRGKKPETIARIIRGPGHGYTAAMIPEAALKRLARFVSAGQIETERYIDYTSGKARGDAARGKAFYRNVCAVCHGFDGRAINFHDEGNPEFVGTIAREAPWELMHKLMNGQPGAAMPAFGVLPRQLLADIVAHAQSLPAK